jgi:ABC-type multidrug transport system fused ATPase/permease subunit
MEDLWMVFCGGSGNLNIGEKPSSSSLVFQPTSCINHALIICFNVLLLIMLLFTFIQKSSSSPKIDKIPPRLQGYSRLQIVSAIFNGCIGFVYLCSGIWILEEKLRKKQTAFPLKSWLVVLFQGFTWLLVCLNISLRGKHLHRMLLRLLSILAFLFAVIVCALSIYSVILGKGILVKIALDVLSFPGAILLLLCVCKVHHHEGSDERDLYAPLNGEANGAIKTDSAVQVTPFAEAGFFNKISFWWLNPLMRKGGEKTLEDKDIPKLREVDRAESCYMEFLEQLNKQNQAESSQPSLLWTIILCHWKEILISGFFALLKILTLSAGPLLLNAFILVAEGKSGFKYEGYVLALTLFFSKNLESLSQRQWYFRSRLIGLKVRSLLTAAIYKKQLRLSNLGRLMHSGGEIMNYVTVDAYRIGEFPFWFHQTWTTSLQICVSLLILYRAVGLATFAALVVIIITVLCNTPIAKLQHKFQSKLMAAQDERLKACNEALVNMKVLKLYAWETHFKNAIENLRAVEYKWLSAVQMRKAYNSFLLWSSPVLISAATFGACYFLKIHLHANNVFTFIAALRLVQDPIRSISDVIGVVVQAKVAFARIVTFLEAPELQSGNTRQKCNKGTVKCSVLIKSADFSWEENPSKPTLRNVSLEMRHGEKVAVCGEVGSGKSTLLAAILGEVPLTQGTVSLPTLPPNLHFNPWITFSSVYVAMIF